MRQVTRYPTSFKDSIIAKTLTPNGPSIVELSKEFNIPYGTIFTWVSTMKKKKKYKPVTTSSRPKDRSAEFKLQALIDTMAMTDEERGAYCREHGIYTHHLDEWKKIILAGLSNSNATTLAQKIEGQKTVAELKKLKSDLHRKDKALAEVSALLILKKKADLLWGEEEDD
jgi:transposase-like protein